jgi:hypothetical protein
MRTEWRPKSHFSEAATILGIETDDVMAMLPNQFIVYIKDEEVWSAEIRRDEEGVLHFHSERPHPDLLNQLKELLNEGEDNE